LLLDAEKECSMGRVALTKPVKLIIAAAVAVVLLGGGAVTYMTAAHNSVQTVSNAQHQLTEISYHGQNGVDALTLLKKHATVSVKHYSFGDLVTSINGSEGKGPKYWTFYVNGKQATAGAGAYKTKDSDTLDWKLQQL
jgi:hypothetical protein